MRELEIKLKETMNRELEAYIEILELAKRKTEILKDSKVTELELLTLDERAKVEEINSIGAERESIARGLADSLGVNERLDLSTMSQYFTDEGQLEFSEIRSDFVDTIEELKKVNSLNETLIKDSLEYIDFSLNIMTSATVGGGYSQNADNSGGESKKNLFDFKA